MKDMKKLKDTALTGALALQSTQLLTNRTIPGMVNTASGFIGIGVAGVAGNVAFDLASGNAFKKKRRK